MVAHAQTRFTCCGWHVIISAALRNSILVSRRCIGRSITPLARSKKLVCRYLWSGASGNTPNHARRACLSRLSILWSAPLICRFAHATSETLSAVPIFSRMSRIMRRNVTGSMRSPLHTCLSFCPATSARSMIASSLVNAGSNRNSEVDWMRITLGSCFIRSPRPSCYRPAALRRNSEVIPWVLASGLRVLAFIEYNAESAAPKRASIVSPSLG